MRLEKIQVRRISARLNENAGQAAMSIEPIGLATFVYILVQYLAGDVRFNELIHLHEAIAASTLMMMGVQLVAASFFLSLLELHWQTRSDEGVVRLP